MIKIADTSFKYLDGKKSFLRWNKKHFSLFSKGCQLQKIASDLKVRFWWKNKNLIKIADISFKYLDDKKSFFKVKQKAFFIIFKRLSVAKNSVRPESALLKKLCKIRELKRHLRNFQGFILLDIITYINFFPQSMTVILPWEEVFFYRPYSVEQMG